MKIETKFEVGQKVFYLDGTKLVENIVHSIGVEVGKAGKTETKYWFFDENKMTRFESRNEEFVFFSKLQFLNQLSNPK